MTTLPQQPTAPRWDQPDARRAAVAVRDALRGIGARRDLVHQVMPQADAAGDGYVYLPPLPLPVATLVADRLTWIAPLPPEEGPKW
jgi:hypothetical protein